MRFPVLALLAGGVLVGSAQAQELRVPMSRISAQGIGEPVGAVLITPAASGVTFVAELRGLPPGEHGLHVHGSGDCGPGTNASGETAAGVAAGGHWDPAGTGAHRGPEGDGHMGDLPHLFVQADGTAKGALLAPRIDDISELQGKALMIHAGGDNYADEPQPLGGGGARIACGVIP